MQPSRSNRRNIIRLCAQTGMAMLLALSAAGQDIKLKATYICNGERLHVESCNIRDLSDNATCMVAHPDRPQHNGFMAYTNETRGDLKKLLPTCQQPDPKQVAAAEARQKKQDQFYDASIAATAKAPSQSEVRAAIAAGSTYKPKTPEQRAMARCITSGRLPASCTGNALLGAFTQMITQVLPGGTADQNLPAGPDMAGVYQGAGNWRLDFADDQVLVNCSFLSPDGHHYAIGFKNNLATITIDTTPKPLVLNLRSDGTMVAPGPVVIDGVIATGGGSSDTYKDQYGRLMSASEAATHAGPVYDRMGNPVNPASISRGSFVPKRVTCPALNLSSKGAGVGVEQLEKDTLKMMFGGDKGAPTPTGIRMRGIFAASTGFSAQFFPESVILGCGPDAAHAYPYTVVADGTKAFVKVDAPDHPLSLAFQPDGSLDAGSGPYQVHGRGIVGQNDNGDFTFVPLEQTCSLAVLTLSKQIPSSGGTAAAAGGALSIPAAPLGNATLSIVSGLQAQPGTPNPLAGHPYVLLRDSYDIALAKGGVSVPAGVSPYKFVASVCAGRRPECQTAMDAIKASAASAARADANGAGTLPGVPAGTYYLMISARYNNRSLTWGQAVQLNPGANSVTLDMSNATPID